MDSTQIASNIRQMTRLQLLVEVLQRVYRMLGEADRERYAEVFAPYIKGTAGQYTYRLKREEYGTHLQRIGEVMARLVEELAAGYQEEAGYQVLKRVFEEHFVVEKEVLRPKEGKELSANSLQSPDDWEAIYRRKRDEEYIGYVANVTETSAPENPFQLVLKVQTEPNTTDDAAILAEVLPEIKERTGVEVMALETIHRGWQGRSLAHHARAMAMYPKPYLQKLIALLKQAEMGVVSDPHTGPLHARVRELLEEGVLVCLGQDDISDAYYPYGRNNMLEVAFLVSHLLWMTTRTDMETLYDMITTKAAECMGLPDFRLEVGAPAHLVVLDVPEVLEALRYHEAPKYVISHGHLVDSNQMEKLIRTKDW